MVLRRKMVGQSVTDLSRRIPIEGVAILCEPDGVAMSSRNQCLSQAHRGSIRLLGNIVA